MQLGTNEPIQCPDASRIGEVTLSHAAAAQGGGRIDVSGGPGRQPLRLDLRPLLVLHDTEERGALIKIPGKIEVDRAHRADHHRLQRHPAVPLRRPDPEVQKRPQGSAGQPAHLRQPDDRRSKSPPTPSRRTRSTPPTPTRSPKAPTAPPARRIAPHRPFHPSFSGRHPEPGRRAPTRPFLFRLSQARRRTGTEPGHHGPAPGPAAPRSPASPSAPSGDRLDLHREGSRSSGARPAPPVLPPPRSAPSAPAWAPARAPTTSPARSTSPAPIKAPRSRWR